MDLTPVQRRSIPDDVFDQLLGRVVDGRVAPGETLLSERRMAEALGVSRPAVREALGRVAALRTAAAERDRRVTALEREREEIGKEQARLRDNLAALPGNSDLARRTIAKMGEFETQMDRLAKDLAAARKEAEDARRTLAETVRGMKL